MLGDATLEGDGTHFVELTFGRAHSGCFLVIFRNLGRLVTTWGAWRKGKWPDDLTQTPRDLAQTPGCAGRSEVYILGPEVFGRMTKAVDPSSQSPALQSLDMRSRDIFRRIVDSYLRDGEPVGSRSLSRILPSSLSPATIRNV